MNDPGTPHYYKTIIPHPDTGLLVVTPFIKYHTECHITMVSLTFGDKYRLYSRVLQPIPVDYVTPRILDEQLAIFDPQAPFAFAVNKIVNAYMPFELRASLRQYQYYKEAQLSISKTIDSLTEKKGAYEVRSAKIVKSLQKANFLGRLMVYDDDIVNDLVGAEDALAAYNRSVQHFTGIITQSALDPRPNAWRTNPRLPSIPTPQSPTCSKEENHRRVQQYPWVPSPDNFEDYDKQQDTLLDHIGQRHSRRAPLPKLDNSFKPWRSNRKKCFKCNKFGHVRSNCPTWAPWERK